MSGQWGIAGSRVCQRRKVCQRLGRRGRREWGERDVCTCTYIDVLRSTCGRSTGSRSTCNGLPWQLQQLSGRANGQLSRHLLERTRQDGKGWADGFFSDGGRTMVILAVVPRSNVGSQFCLEIHSRQTNRARANRF